MLIGHQKQWKFLVKSVELGKLPHALLFTGQEKLGKRTLAFEFAKWLFTPHHFERNKHQKTENSSIEKNKLQNGREDLDRRQHPDFIFITPINKEIQISQIRELIWKLSLRPFLAPLKIAIIDQAHCLNQEAQNCFLKTLEEPKGKTLIILITEAAELLFPTVISRSELIKFYPVPKTEIEDYLKKQGIGEKEVEIISQISQGRPGVAVDFLKEPKKLKERTERINEFVRLAKSDLPYRFRCAKAMSKNTDLKETLNVWLSHFRDILLSKINEKQKISISDINKLKQIQSTNFLISATNANPRLALEILMLEL